MTAAAVASLAAAFAAAAAPASPIHAIATEAEARKVCAATAPNARTGGDVRGSELSKRRRELLRTEFEASVPLSQLDLDDVDEEQRELTFRRRDLLRPGLGVFLFLEEQELVLVAQPAAPGAAKLPLARVAAALAQQPKALLRLRFHLADVDGAGPCRLAAKPGSPPVVSIEPLSWELFDESGKLAAVGGPDVGGERRAPAGGTPTVTVAPATIDGAGPTAGDVTARAVKEEAGLRSCYEAALALDPTVDGSLVLSISIGADGKAREVKTTADSVNDPALAGCATKLFSAVQWGKGGPSLALIPVHFERK